ncbi:MAG: hypothetical protein WAW17_07095 [Rhodococcus sp. (in: high G+C Gram-positive bacteria)]|uniref:MinD/ParA family ATP-binding protein n=1 Tax=Rhodococcus sp. TaxID=1831 RepID=UPI003BB17A2E
MTNLLDVAVDSATTAPAPTPATPAAATTPRPSFTAVRPRNISPVASAAPADATPADIDIDDVAEISTPQISNPTPKTDDQLSQILDGVSVEQLRELLAKNPQLLDQAVSAASTATDTTVVADAEASIQDAPHTDTTLARSDLATQGWRAWLVKLGIPLRKGGGERFCDLMDFAHAVIRRDLGGPIVIGVTSYRGSCGKTSATVLFARLLAEIRGDNVIALDTDLHGTLLSRASSVVHESTSNKSTMSTLAEALRSGGVDVTRRVWDGGGGFAFVPGSRTHKANTVTGDEYHMVVEAVRQVSSIVLVDMSALSDTALCQAALDSLDGLVMVSPTAQDSVQALYETQSDLQQRGVGHLNRHRITMLNNTSPVRTLVDTEEFARGLKHRDKRDVVEIPYDRHLAMSKEIDISQLSTSAKTVFVLTLAALIDTFDARKVD